MSQLAPQGLSFSIPIWMMFKSSNTLILLAVKLSLNIKRANANVLVCPSFWQLMTLRKAIFTVYENSSLGKPALKALNWCNWIHYLQIVALLDPNTVSIILQDCSKSFVLSHIYCLRPVEGIRQPFLTQRAMITNWNFTVSSILSP